MEIASLKVFQKVAEVGSFSKAAEILNYAQSNITTKIQKLETELQVPIFYRHNRGITLTPNGKMLLHYTEKIFHLLEEAQKAVQDSPHPSGPLIIGSMETTAAVRLPLLLSNYHNQYPKVDLTLITGPTEQHVNGILQYELDGAFVAGPIEHPDIIQETVLEEELVLVTNPVNHPLQSIKDLRSNTLLVFRSGCSYRAKLTQWLHEEGMIPVKIMEFGSLEAILGCVSAGLGITLLPRSIVQEKVQEGVVQCHSIPEKYGKVQTVFIRRKDAFSTSALQKFLEMVRKCNQKIP